MGSVWLSHHSGLNLPVAIKLLNMQLAEEDPDFLNRFMQEGRLAGQLNHKNIVRIYDAGIERGAAFIAMEYIEGCDTLELLKSRGALPADEVLALAIGIGEALQEAHSLGIIHRDIKPDNILATTEGRIKLADLGLAKQINDEFGSTMAGTALGTPYYISPEQALDAMKADARSDIYSFGATLYHLLSGHLPYEGDNVMGVMLRHANEPLTPPQDKNPDIPISFCNVICKMMEKNPDDRYQKCSELLEDFFKMKYGSEDVASSEEDLINQSETQLSQKLTSSKSVRIKAKFTADGKYAHAHKSPLKTQRNLKKRKGASSSNNKAKKKNLLVPVTISIAVLILAVALLPSILKKSTVEDAEVNVEKNISIISETAPRNSLTSKKNNSPPLLPENEVIRTVDLLENDGQDHLAFDVPEMISFKDGHMIINGATEKGKKLLSTKNSFTNYKIIFEYKWLEKNCDTDLKVNSSNGVGYEVNIANTFSSTGILFGRGGEFNLKGKTLSQYFPKEKLARELDVWHTIEIICKDNTLCLKVNETELYTVSDLASSSGQIKMTIWRKLNIEIRKFMIIELD